MAGRHGHPRPAPRRLLPCCTVAVGAVMLAGSVLQLVPVLDQRREAAAVSSTTGGSPAYPNGFEGTGTAADEFVVDETTATALSRRAAAGAQAASEQKGPGGARAPGQPGAWGAQQGRAQAGKRQHPRRRVQARLIRLGLNPDKTLQVPRSYSLAGWYTKGAAPGEVGPAVVLGHYDSVDGPAVFYRLKDLRPGQIVHIRRADGFSAKFVVDRVKRFGKDDFPTHEVYGRVDRPNLRLITCGGSFDYATRHYRDNVVVFAHLVQ